MRSKGFDIRTNEARGKNFKDQFDMWGSYIQKRFGELPEELIFTDRMRKSLEHVYQHHKDRREGILLGDKVIDMHFDYATMFKFNPVIDLFFIEQMIHPSRGYLCHLNSGITLESLYELYETLIVATWEKLSGQVVSFYAESSRSSNFCLRFLEHD